MSGTNRCGKGGSAGRNVVEIVFRPTGGTEKVAHMIGKAWSERAVKIDLSDSGTDFAQWEIQKEDGDVASIPGNRPYKKGAGVGLVPKATKDCVSCGLCA